MSVISGSSSSYSSFTDISSVHSTSSSVFSENYYENLSLTAKHGFYLLFANINNAGKGHHPRFQLGLRILEYLQLLSLGFITWYNQWGKLDEQALQYIGYLWNFGVESANYTDSVVLLAFVIIYLLVLLVLGLRLMINYLDGDEKKSRKSMVFSGLLQIYPVLYLPIVSLCSVFLNCRVEQGGRLASFPDIACMGTTNAVIGAFAAATLIASIGFGACSSLMYYPWVPHKRNFVATVNGRIWFIFFLGKTLLGLSGSFFFGHHYFHVARCLIHSFLLLLAFGALFSWTIYSLPFYHFRANLVASGMWTVGLLTGILRVASVVIPHSIVPFIILLVMIPPGVILSVYLTKRRLTRLAQVPIAHDQNGETDQQQIAHFNNDFEVEIATRYAYFHSDESDVETVTMIFLHATEQFPQSILVKAAHTIFLLPFSEELQVLSIVVARAKRSHFTWANWDYEYLIFAVEKALKQKLCKVDGGVEEIQGKIRQATKYQDACTKNIKTFWMQLMKEQDLGGLTDIVAQIERNELKAEAIYKKLLIRFPKNARVMRAYGAFLEEIKNDIELAQVAFRNADEVEEERARHNKNKKHGLMKKKAAPAPIPLQDNYVHSEEDMDPVQTEREVSDEDEEWVEKEVTQKPKPAAPIGVITATAAPTKSKRAERLRQRKYKQDIENSKSTALRKLSIAVIVTVLMLFLDLMVLYIGTRVTLQNYERSLERLGHVADTRTLCQKVVLHARQGEISAIEGEFNDTTFRKEEVHKYASGIRDLIQNHIRNNYGSTDIEDEWLTPRLNQSEFVPGDGDSAFKEYSIVSLMDMSTQFVSSALFVASMNETDFAEATHDVSFRYVIDNGMHSMIEGFARAVGHETDLMDSYGKSFHTILGILLGTSIAVLLAVVAIFFVPALQKIKEERSKALKLFLAIPKSTIAGIYENLSKDDENEVKDIEEEQYQEEMALAGGDLAQSGGMPIIRKLILRYALSVTIVLGFIAALFALPTLYVVHYDTLGHELNYSKARNYLTDRVVSLGWELIFDGEHTWDGGRVEIRDHLELARELLDEYENAISYGSSKLHVRDVGKMDPALEDLTFNTPCHLYGTDADCFGTQSLFKFFERDSLLLSNQPDDLLVYRNPYIWSLMELETQLSNMLDEFEQLFQDYSFGLSTKVAASVSIVYAISFPVLIVVYFLLRPLEKRVKEENMRTMKMLLMIPIDVIDSVEEIKTYLDSGLRGDMSDKKVSEILQDKLERSKKIIDQCADAIVVINDDGLIEVFNPAAERLFGFSIQEALNQNVSMLMPEEIAHIHQSYIERYKATGKAIVMGKTMNQTAKRKDGNLIPVSLSLSEVKVGGNRSLYAAFFKDITEQKEYEKELLKERDYSEQLLGSLLPASIAKQLKEEARTAGSEGVLIAEAYKEVTVLFADIVGFTTMSGKIRPTELVQMLSKLFSKWDALATKYGVEKIKTIGDCYMAASGVPLRSLDHASNMLEFAIEMQSSLQEINKELTKNLQIRIGINSGPVVAGVIGTAKMAFDLWGDAVNVASRMESTGLPNRIQVSQSTFELLKEEYVFEERGRQEVKGKGIMLTYLYKERRYDRTASGHKVRRQTFTPMGIQSAQRNASGTMELLMRDFKKNDLLPARTDSKLHDIKLNELKDNSDSEPEEETKESPVTPFEPPSTDEEPDSAVVSSNPSEPSVESTEPAAVAPLNLGTVQPAPSPKKTPKLPSRLPKTKSAQDLKGKKVNFK